MVGSFRINPRDSDRRRPVEEDRVRDRSFLPPFPWRWSVVEATRTSSVMRYPAFDRRRSAADAGRGRDGFAFRDRRKAKIVVDRGGSRCARRSRRRTTSLQTASSTCSCRQSSAAGRLPWRRHKARTVTNAQCPRRVHQCPRLEDGQKCRRRQKNRMMVAGPLEFYALWALNDISVQFRLQSFPIQPSFCLVFWSRA